MYENNFRESTHELFGVKYDVIAITPLYYIDNLKKINESCKKVLLKFCAAYKERQFSLIISCITVSEQYFIEFSGLPYF